ncbi:HD-GYP domain-containing protein [Thermosipho melanesiensis]|uniref:Metal dependent phosphohydrolase n=2 Tax=Thermosipho melanesiensis TaxID=46541 RepID=A6LP01_THEM4|nr:HD-GYP domain-containing protein [Thermosipho melanesiensis]ABR31652.1 metal dependent phosphohydrolase [Thermosipho melanesiensis BI429]APT74954.1 hypothetical protein BW47_09555 [Thermosipho melanesiensis]
MNLGVIKCLKDKSKKDLRILYASEEFLQFLNVNEISIFDDISSRLDEDIVKKIKNLMFLNKPSRLFVYSVNFSGFIEITVIPEGDFCWIVFSDLSEFLKKQYEMNRLDFFNKLELELLSVFIDPKDIFEVYNSLVEKFMKIDGVYSVGIFRVENGVVKEISSSKNFVYSDNLELKLTEIYKNGKYYIEKINGKYVLFFPIYHSNIVIEIVIFELEDKKFFDEYLLNFLKEIEVAISMTIDRISLKNEISRKNHQLLEAIDDIIEVMSKIVELRDPYTAGHQKNVSRLSYEIGKRLGFDNERLLILKYAALVHDIGKIGVPIEILVKPSKLSDLEFNLIKEHPKIGYNLLSDLISPYDKISEIVLQHHERIDGSGYPFGLKGDDILMESKVIAVADTVDAMISHRPYRPSLGLEKAIVELKNNARKKYDEKVVEVCLDLFNEGFKFY